VAGLVRAAQLEGAAQPEMAVPRYSLLGSGLTG
jgi:hypothetical protein